MSNFIPKIEYIELYTNTPKTFTFDNPPEKDPFNEDIKGVYKESVSSNGNFQRQFNYIEQTFDLDFRFQSSVVTAAMDDFIKNHAMRGGVFKYYPSSDEGEYEIYRLDTTSYKKQRPIFESGGPEFEYHFKFSIVRTIDYVIDIGEGADVGSGSIGETKFNLNNNQLTPADITGLDFDATATLSATVTYLIYRNTTGAGATELVESGKLYPIYKSGSSVWTMTRAADNSDNDPVGVTLTITSTGQVQYISTNITGTPDESYISFRASTIGVA